MNTNRIFCSIFFLLYCLKLVASDHPTYLLKHSNCREIFVPPSLPLTSTYIVPESEVTPKHSVFGTLKLFGTSLVHEVRASVSLRRKKLRPHAALWQHFAHFPDDEGGASRGLYVFIHGLNAHPAAWEPYLAELASLPEPPLLWAPATVDKGNCPEEMAVAPLIAALTKFLTHHPEQPIIIIASSLGARLAARLEIALRRFPSRIAIFSLGGVYFGSTRISLRRPFTDSTLYQALHYASPSSFRLIDDMRQKLPSDVEGRYTFYASSHDSRVVPFTSGLPLLGQGERHFVVEGVDHCGLVPELAPVVVSEAETWRADTLRR